MMRLAQYRKLVCAASRRSALTQPLMAKLNIQIVSEHQNSENQTCSMWIFPSRVSTKAAPEPTKVKRLNRYRMLTRIAGPSGRTSRLAIACRLPHIQRRRCLKYAPQVHGEVSSMYSWNQPQ